MADRNEFQEQLSEASSKAFDTLVQGIVDPTKQHIGDIIGAVDALQHQFEGVENEPSTDVQEQLRKREEQLREREQEVHQLTQKNRSLEEELESVRAERKRLHEENVEHREQIRELKAWFEQIQGQQPGGGGEEDRYTVPHLRSALISSRLLNNEYKQRLDRYEDDIKNHSCPPPVEDEYTKTLNTQFAELRLKSLRDSEMEQRLKDKERQLQALEDSQYLLRSQLELVRKKTEGHVCRSPTKSATKLEEELANAEKRYGNLRESLSSILGIDVDEIGNAAGGKDIDKEQALEVQNTLLRDQADILRYELNRIADEVNRPTDEIITQRYNDLHKNIERFVNTIFDTDLMCIDRNHAERAEIAICKEIKDAPAELERSDRLLRIRGAIFGILHSEILSNRIFGVEGWVMTDASNAESDIDIAPGLVAFEEALLGSEQVTTQDVVKWRHMTLERIAELNWKTKLVKKANDRIIKLLEWLFAEIEIDDANRAVRDSVIELCQKAFRWRILARRGEGLTECVVPGPGVGISELVGPGDRAAFNCCGVEAGGPNERSDDIAYTLYGAVLKGFGNRVTVLTTGLVLAKKDPPDDWYKKWDESQ